MDQESKEKLKRIVEKEVDELDGEEIKFIRARRSYLSPSERDKFYEILPIPRKTELNYLHICDAVIISKENNNLSLINIFNGIKGKSFPVVHPRFSIITNISGETGEHNQVVEIISPAGQVISRIEGKSSLVDNGTHNFIANFLMVTLPLAGRYFVRVTVDDDVVSKENRDFFDVGNF